LASAASIHPYDARLDRHAVRVWIDLANSPHPLLFAPIARRFEQDGHTVLLTARDNAQTLELAQDRWPAVEVIGGPSPRGRAAKAKMISARVLDLRRWVSRAQPDVALSHNSYAQIVAAQAAGIPVVTAMDFEHQPANHLAFRLARTVLLPEVLPLEDVRRYGASRKKVVLYPGLKEELYVGDFDPDPRILEKVGIRQQPAKLVIARTPPNWAVYHHFDNPLFLEALRAVCAREGIVCVALARRTDQAEMIEGLRLPNCLVPKQAIDSRSLMCKADMMIGAGGTMTREAAVMGIPTWTVFAGATPAVDRWLENQRLLRRLTQPSQLADSLDEPARRRTPDELRERSQPIQEVVIRATLDATVA
jgi:uncharacterized protein